MSTYKINIETLSPVHIGDGEFLKYGSDFVHARSSYDEGSSLYVIDPKKIWDVVGQNRLDKWMAAIDRGEDALQFVQGMDKRKQAKDIALREIPNYASKVVKTDTLKSCIHDGSGRPYIPGSSLKGAIRTAVLASLAPGVKNIDKVVADRGGYSARQVEKELFGNDPKNNLFRFLQVGDAYFEAGSEISFRMVNLNIRDSKIGLLDESKPQLIEAIGCEDNAVFSINIPDELLNHFRNMPENSGGNYSFLSISELFKIINAHILKLLDKEINFWKNIEDNEGKDGADGYLDGLQARKSDTKNCKEGRECVLRVGHGSGWRFITGAWAEKLSNFNNKDGHSMVDKIRRKNHLYQNYDFPKSRRIEQEESEVLGFVKLSY